MLSPRSKRTLHLEGRTLPRALSFYEACPHIVRETMDRFADLTGRRYRLFDYVGDPKADRVIVPSQSTKKDLQIHYGIPADKITIVPEGAPDSFRPIADEALLRATRHRWLGEDRPYILFVGKMSQRRNIPLLMKAFAVVKKREKIPISSPFSLLGKTPVFDVSSEKGPTAVSLPRCDWLPLTSYAHSRTRHPLVGVEVEITTRVEAQIVAEPASHNPF